MKKTFFFFLLFASISSFAQSKPDSVRQETNDCDGCISLRAMADYIAANEERKYMENCKCVIIIVHEKVKKEKAKKYIKIINNNKNLEKNDLHNSH